MNLQRRESHGTACRQAVGLRPHRRSEGTKTLYHNRKDAEPVFITTIHGKKKAGDIVTENGQHIFEKHVIESKHFCRKHSGFGIQEELLYRLPKLGVNVVRIFSDRGTVEEVSLSDWKEYGKQDDLGHGYQIFLNRKHYHRIDQAQGDLFGESLCQ